MNKEKSIERIQELYTQDRIALRCEREELGCTNFEKKYDLKYDTIRKHCPGVCDRTNTIRKHIMRGVTYPELRKMWYSDRFIVQKMDLYSKPPRDSDKIEPVEPPRPVHREYVAYWMDDSVVDPDRPLKCEKTKNIVKG